MFSRHEYIDSILADAITYRDDDSNRDRCRNCGEEERDWDLPIGYMQPPGMPDRLCVACWADEAADRWEEEEADRRAAG